MGWWHGINFPGCRSAYPGLWTVLGLSARHNHKRITIAATPWRGKRGAYIAKAITIANKYTNKGSTNSINKVLWCFLRRREETCDILRRCGELVRQHIRKVVQCPKGISCVGSLLFLFIPYSTFSKTAVATNACDSKKIVPAFHNEGTVESFY